MRIVVKVKPRSGSEGVKRIDEETLQVKVKEPPAEGRANRRVIELVAKYFRVPKSRVKIVKGERSREKVIEIS